MTHHEEWKKTELPVGHRDRIEYERRQHQQWMHEHSRQRDSGDVGLVGGLVGGSIGWLLGWVLKIGLAVAAVLVVVFLVSIPFGLVAAWWESMAGGLRAVLNVSPVAAAVADQPGGEGAPLVVAIFLGVCLIAGLAGMTVWMRRISRRRRGEGGGFAPLLGTGFLRALIFMAGVPLIPVAAAVAAGETGIGRMGMGPVVLDTTREVPVLGGLAIVMGALALLTWLSTRRLARRAPSLAGADDSPGPDPAHEAVDPG